MKTKVIRTATIVMFLVISLILPVQAGPSGQGPPPTPPGPTDETLIGQLQQETDGKTRISYHAGTGKVRFIGTDLEHTISQPTKLAADATAEDAARQFLATYGQLFGLTDQARELTVTRSKTVDRGRAFSRFQQVYQGIPVLGGELIVQLDANKDVISANGEVLPDLKVNVVPTIGAETARQRALAMVAKNYGLSTDDLSTTEPELWIYSPILLGGPGLRLTTLVWRMDVEPVELLPIRELVLVDAHQGMIVLHFNQIDAAKNRLVYDAQGTDNLPGTLCRSEGDPPSGDTDCDNAYDYAGDTYDFYWNTHGRDSIDNAGMDLISTVHYCLNSSCPYQNAFWSSQDQQMVYGEGFPAADDVVAHEMTHGVTQYESNLFYYMQSGAINEAFSDIWGEFIDLTNGAGTDTSAVRWLMGEDVPGFGAIRDMSNPPAYGDPDRMGSTYYYCGELDNGGVHSNGGVANKAAYLMVDGDAFNGYTVTGIGIDKTAKIWYEVQTNMFTSASDYQDLYDGLQQACTSLIGTSGITASDCQEVKDAVDATEMNQRPSSCPATHAPICPLGQSPNNLLFFDDMENTSSGKWTHGAITGNDEWYYPQNSHSYTGWDATYATSGVYNIWGYDQPSTADYYMAMTSDVALPAASQPYLHFNHAYAFEDYGSTMYDGGVLEYSTNGGSSWNDAGSLFTHNGYDGTISSSWGNPLGGRQAFGRESNGYFSSRLDLSSLAGQDVRFRFCIGTDSSFDAYGWFIDDVRIYTCPLPDIEVSPASFEETVPVDKIVTKTLTISNVGQGTLSFSISDVETTTSMSTRVESKLSGTVSAEIIEEENTGGLEKLTTKALTQDEQHLLLFSQQKDTLKSKTAISDLPIVKSFPSPTSAPRGLEYDGTHLYVAQASSEDYIYEIDPETGTVVDTYSWTLSGFPIGLAWDGVNFYVSDDTSQLVYVVDTSFNLVKQFSAPETWQRDMAYDGTNLLEATSYTDKIWTLDTDDGSIIDVFSTPLDWPAGLAWDGTYIWHSNSEFLGPGDYIYKLDTDGAVLEQYNSPGTYPTGLAFDGQYLWCVDWDTDRIYQLDIGYISDCPWLDENPKSDSVSPGEHEEITVSIDTTGLDPGEYSANVVISNNDPDENPVTVPVVMHTVKGLVYLPIILKNYP